MDDRRVSDFTIADLESVFEQLHAAHWPGIGACLALQAGLAWAMHRSLRINPLPHRLPRNLDFV